MFILAGKHLLRLLLAFIYLTNAIIEAQPNFLSYFCDNAVNYTRNSTYRRNLDSTLAALPTTNSGFGFFNHSAGQGIESAKSVALCRGDVEAESCRRCLNESTTKLREICPNQVEAIGYYDNCLLKYSNETILGTTDIGFLVTSVNSQNSSDTQRFNAALRPLLNGLVDTAAGGGSLRKFAIGNTSGPNLSTIYGLVQCTPELQEQDCATCLGSSISQFLSTYFGRIGGRALTPLCNFRYENYGFYNARNLVIPPPPPPPPPSSEASPPVSSPNAGKRKLKRKTKQKQKKNQRSDREKEARTRYTENSR